MKIILLPLLFVGLLSTSCATVSFSDSETRRYTVAYEKAWAHLFLGRAVGFADVRIACPESQKVSQFQVQLTPGQGFISILTPYSPVTTSYWCE